MKDTTCWSRYIPCHSVENVFRIWLLSNELTRDNSHDLGDADECINFEVGIWVFSGVCNMNTNEHAGNG